MGFKRWTMLGCVVMMSAAAAGWSGCRKEESNGGEHDGHAAHAQAVGHGPLHAPDAPPPAGYEKVDKTIVIGTIKAVMKYDVELIEVVPGAKVKLVLNNTDDMPHNLLICKPGEDVTMKVAMAAWALGEKALEKNYVPESDLVLHATGLVNPRQADTLYFTAPADEGDYPYVCTFPGHAFTMKGVLRVGKATGLSDLVYRYYEGQWDKLPDFKKLPPIDSARVEDAVIDIALKQRSDNFGFVFSGKLTAPADGTYTFALNSDDGSRLLINGKIVVDHDGLHSAGPDKAGQVDLKAGVHAFEVQHFERGGEELLEVSWAGPDFEQRYLSRRSADAKAGQAPGDTKNHLHVTDAPRVIRCVMPDSSPRSIAVGLPGGINYCFDAEACVVRYGWFGPFLDAGPDRGDGKGRGGQPNRPLGVRFGVGADGMPLKIGGTDAMLKPQFTGYEIAGQSVKFFYTLGETQVSQTIAAAQNGVGLTYTFELKPAPKEPVTFTVKPEGLTLSGTAGAWKGGVLSVPAAKAQSFSVTLIEKK